MNDKRYEVVNVHGAISIYDNEKAGCGQSYGHIIRMGVCGDGHSCLYSSRQALLLARKLCKFLNKD